WARVRELFGPDDENFTALSTLLDSEERWDELATLLESEAVASESAERRVALLVRLGDVLRDRMRAVDRAAPRYPEALTLDARSAPAREGLLSLWKHTSVTPVLVDVLSAAYVDTGDWARAAELADLLSAPPPDADQQIIDEPTSPMPVNDVPAPLARAF